MFRRAFLAAGASALAAAPVLAAGALPTAAGPRHRLTGTYLTAIDAAALDGIGPGTPLSLRRDPTRRFEPATAVAVFAAGRRLGYLPGTAGKMVAPLLESDAVPLDAEVTRVLPGATPTVDLDLYIVST
jgi:hypothetical protein